jgi:hypothetical protein
LSPPEGYVDVVGAVGHKLWNLILASRGSRERYVENRIAELEQAPRANLYVVEQRFENLSDAGDPPAPERFVECRASLTLELLRERVATVADGGLT